MSFFGLIPLWNNRSTIERISKCMHITETKNANVNDAVISISVIGIVMADIITVVVVVAVVFFWCRYCFSMVFEFC